MYIPSYDFIARVLSLPKDPMTSPRDGRVNLDVRTLRLLLQFVALAADYDEATYLKENPDLAEAYQAGAITDLHRHFTENGFFEGRKAAPINFNENWYLKTYPDVSDAIKEGSISSALDHFVHRGDVELRAPNEEALSWMRNWVEILSRRALSLV